MRGEEATDQDGVHGAVLGDVLVHVLLQVHREELEYQVQLRLLQEEQEEGRGGGERRRRRLRRSRRRGKWEEH